MNEYEIEQARIEKEKEIKAGEKARQRQIIRRVLASAVFVAGIGGVILWKDYDATHITEKEIEREIDVHTGHEVINGERTDPHLGHDCELDYIEDTKGVTEYEKVKKELENTMRDQGYSEEAIENAKERYDLEYADKVEEAKKIRIGH